MPVPNWPVSLPQRPRSQGFSGGPQDSRARFDPDYGPPILRRRTTANPRLFDATFPNLRAVQLEAFDAFYDADLAGGALAFAWRDPVRDDVALWRIVGTGDLAYSVAARRGDLHDLSLRLMRLPGAPWWAPYVRPGASVVPEVVADWDAGVHGIGGARVTASALPGVTGTFDVYSVSSTDVETFTAGVVIGAGDIPATAPALTKRRVYFAA